MNPKELDPITDPTELGLITDLFAVDPVMDPLAMNTNESGAQLNFLGSNTVSNFIFFIRIQD